MAAPMTYPRGLRQNNPGNLRAFANSVPWLGQTGVDAYGMCIFDTMRHGVRAAARLLIAYQQRHGLRTVRKIISRWAPPNENDTAAYIADVCARMDVAADDPINVMERDTLEALASAIFWHENGALPPAADIMGGVADALAS